MLIPPKNWAKIKLPTLSSKSELYKMYPLFVPFGHFVTSQDQVEPDEPLETFCETGGQLAYICCRIFKIGLPWSALSQPCEKSALYLQVDTCSNIVIHDIAIYSRWIVIKLSTLYSY